jgi:spore cortex formation protein SpoVR/YcgB (stage V sporulation)
MTNNNKWIEEKVGEYKTFRTDYVNAYVNHVEIHGYKETENGIDGVLSFEKELEDSANFIQQALQEAYNKGREEALQTPNTYLV